MDYPSMLWRGKSSSGSEFRREKWLTIQDCGLGYARADDYHACHFSFSFVRLHAFSEVPLAFTISKS